MSRLLYKHWDYSLSCYISTSLAPSRLCSSSSSHCYESGFRLTSSSLALVLTHEASLRSDGTQFAFYSPIPHYTHDSRMLQERLRFSWGRFKPPTFHNFYTCDLPLWARIGSSKRTIHANEARYGRFICGIIPWATLPLVCTSSLVFISNCVRIHPTPTIR